MGTWGLFQGYFRGYFRGHVMGYLRVILKERLCRLKTNSPLSSHTLGSTLEG
jgi:hypothetical protein